MKGYIDIFRIKSGKVVVDKVGIENLEKFESELKRLDKFSKEFGEMVIAHGYRVNDNLKVDNCFGLMLPDQISEASYMAFKRIFRDLENFYEKSKKSFIVNHNFESLGDDYDYVTEYGYSSGSILGIADCFCQEKLDKLNEEERDLISNYRQFDLEKILVGNYTGLPICHGNAGIMIITEENTIKSTVKTESHPREIRKFFKMLYDENSIPGSVSNATYCGLFNDVIVQIAKNMVLVYAPKELTAYQKKELSDLWTNVKQLSKNSADNMMLFACVVKYNEERKEWDSEVDTTLEDYVGNYVVGKSTSLKSN